MILRFQPVLGCTYIGIGPADKAVSLIFSHPGELSCFRKPGHIEDSKRPISDSRVPEWVNVCTWSGSQGRAGRLGARDQLGEKGNQGHIGGVS